MISVLIIILAILINFIQIKPIKMASQVDTPQNVKRYLFKTDEKANNVEEVDCQYCEMKKKFNLGSNGDQKCFEHSVKR